MRPTFLDGDDLSKLVPIADAIDTLDRTFSLPLPASPQRARVQTRVGELLLMPAVGETHAGVKLVSVAPGNPSRGRPLVQAQYVLFEAETLTPVAVLDGTALTTLRTAAVSALATRYLARDDSRTLVIIGAGVQGRAHLLAMPAVRPVGRVLVISRSPGPAEELVELARSLGLDAALAGPDAVAQADIVCTCTTSPVPVFEGSALPEGAHINAVGAYLPDQRELDTETVRRARVVVELRDAALAEAGDLLIPIGEGAIGPSHIVADLAELVDGAGVRRHPGDVTLFKSVGLALEDLVIAGLAYERATG